MKIHVTATIPDELRDSFLNTLLQWEKPHRDKARLDIFFEQAGNMTADELNRLITRMRPDIPIMYSRTIPRDKEESCMREPDLKGKAEAWTLALNKSRKDWQPAWEGTIALYLLHCTWSHPFWTYYFISGVHLRPIRGTPPAHKAFPEASHEIIIYSLDPAYIPDPDKFETGDDEFHRLEPPDLVHQVEGLTDDQFSYLVQDVVMTIIAGKASPDVDFRSYWKRSIDGVALQLRQGRVANSPEVDRSKRCMLSGEKETPEHREIQEDGMQKDYVVLCPDERAKGFVRPVRRSYIHIGKPPEGEEVTYPYTKKFPGGCGSRTTMGLALAETYARDPGFYSGTFCCSCKSHFPLDQFVWEGTTEQLGT